MEINGREPLDSRGIPSSFLLGYSGRIEKKKAYCRRKEDLGGAKVGGVLVNKEGMVGGWTAVSEGFGERGYMVR